MENGSQDNELVNKNTNKHDLPSLIKQNNKYKHFKGTEWKEMVQEASKKNT